MEPPSTARKGIINLGTAEDPEFTVITIGPDTDDRAGYAATAQYFEEFSAALAELERLRVRYPEACMRYMHNEPELGLLPYWEVDQDAGAMAARLAGPVAPAMLYALKQGGLGHADAVRLSHWRDEGGDGDGTD